MVVMIHPHATTSSSRTQVRSQSNLAFLWRGQEGHNEEDDGPPARTDADADDVVKGDDVGVVAGRGEV